MAEGRYAASWDFADYSEVAQTRSNPESMADGRLAAIRDLCNYSEAVQTASEKLKIKEDEGTALRKELEQAGQAGEAKQETALREAQESYVSCNKDLESKVEELGVMSTDLVAAQKQIKELEEVIAGHQAKIAAVHEELHDALTSEANHTDPLPGPAETTEGARSESTTTPESATATPEGTVIPEPEKVAEASIEVSDAEAESPPPTAPQGESVPEQKDIKEPIGQLTQVQHEGGDDL
ncbi:hypothetical protein CYMTET_6027 [Cymbomonas tetramitiformis]|uniref:Uncharacterized protein n=1 Tax=Cymbomonas tetramitiformis TaxID=36881 RepID=A0AAE0GXZ3_9CHLO|nr:hypothetical protein CYMTET_6027 [Cymbomonas tetramitiformis]